MKRDILYPLTIISFIFLLSFFIIKPVLAGVPFSDDFESYNLGSNVIGQGNWGGYRTPTISDERSTNGTQSVKIDEFEYLKGYGATTQSGQWCVDYYTNNPNDNHFNIRIENSGNKLWSIFIDATTKHLIFFPENGGAADMVDFGFGIPANRWNTFCFEINEYTSEARAKINDNDWTIWKYNPFSGVNGILLMGQNISYFDNLTFPIMPPAVYLGFPPEGTTTIQQTGHFTASGSYFYDNRVLNTWSAVDWSTLTAIFSQGTTTFSFSTDISATSTGNFDIPVILDTTGIFAVNFMFEGNRIFDNLPVISIPHIATTTIQIGEIGTPIWIETAEPELFEEPEPTGILEHIAWSIKKFFRGLIVPSNNAKQNFLDKISTIKERFPYNYISEFKNFINDVKTGTIQDKPFNFSFFGATGTATFLMTDENISSGGITKKFSDWFRLLFSGFLIIGFVLYLVGFIKRIL